MQGWTWSRVWILIIKNHFFLICPVWCSLIKVNGEVHEFIDRKRREYDGEDKMQRWTWWDEKYREKEEGLREEMRGREKKEREWLV